MGVILMKYAFSVLVLGVLLLAACTAQQASTQDVNQQPPASDQNQPQVPNQNAQQPPATTAPAASDAKSELTGIFAKQVEFSVDYNLVTATQGKELSYDYQEYVKGANIRTDMITSSIESRTYMIGSKITSCSKAAEQWTCIALSAPSQDNAMQDDAKDNVEQYAVVKLPARTIAGVSTSCYRITINASTLVDYCYSPEGVPLYTKTTAKGYTSEMTAKSYLTSVPDETFTLPAEPQAMPELPQGVTIPNY
jgi:hypothetical protein